MKDERGKRMIEEKVTIKYVIARNEATSLSCNTILSFRNEDTSDSELAKAIPTSNSATKTQSL